MLSTSLQVCVRIAVLHVLWLQAIEGYREMEKLEWNTVNSLVVGRLKMAACEAIGTDCSSLLPSLHVLDLAADG